VVDRLILPATVLGAALSGAEAFAALVVAQASTGGTDVGNIATGGGALGLTAVLGFIALKLSRGELVVRDAAAVEAALIKVGEERKAERTEVVELRNDNAELAREAIAELALARAELTLTRAELARHRHHGGTA
jgi:hypothetical protein